MPRKRKADGQPVSPSVSAEGPSAIAPDHKKKVTRPDVAARLKRRHTIEEKAVKMKLASFCTSFELALEIDICAKGVTRTCVEASRFLNLHVLRSLDAGLAIPKLDQTYFYRLLSTVAGKPDSAAQQEFGFTIPVFEALRPHNMTRFDPRNAMQMLNYAGKGMLTACKNHVVLNISSRAAKAFKLFFKQLPQQYKAPDRNKVCSLYMRSMERQVVDAQATWQSLSRPPTAATVSAVQAYIDRDLQQYADLPLDIGGISSTERVKKRWWCYLRWLRDLQRVMEQHEARTFSILPLNTFDAKYITIDTGILHGLLARVAERIGEPGPGPLSAFRQHRQQHWEHFFRLTRAEGTNKRLNFEYMLLSDGYAVSVLLSQTKQQYADPEVYATVHATPDLRGKRVVAVDPGRRDLFTAVTSDAAGRDSYTRYSNAEYREKIGATKAQQKRRRWLESAALEQLLELPSAKTSSSAAMEHHIIALFKILDDVLHHNCAWRVRALRFTQYGCRQKVMHDICNRLETAGTDADDDRRVVIAYGAGSFSPSSKGHCPGPVKAVYRQLKRRGMAEVYKEGEAYSSQLCSCCHHKLVPMYGQGDSGAIHAVRRCLNTECWRTVWHRDRNAAQNIRHTFLHTCYYGSRPLVFTRAFQMRRRQHTRRRSSRSRPVDSVMPAL